MPKVRRQRMKPPPDGWDEIEPTLNEFERKMREGAPEPLQLRYNPLLL